MKNNQQNNPLWRNGQTPSSEQTPQPEKESPVIEAQEQNQQSGKHKRKH